MIAPAPTPPNRPIDQESLFEKLRAGHTLVSGNTRLSRVLTDRYNHWRIAAGERQWPSPVILPWQAWLGKLWESASLKGLIDRRLAVPSGLQLLNLWERVLEADADSRFLLRPGSLAPTMCETRRLVREWQLDLADPAWHGSHNENHAAFHRWNRAFERLCETEGWIAPEDRGDLLCRAISQSGFRVTGPLDLLGFDEFSPSQAVLLGHLEDSGTPVSRLKLTPAGGRAVLWKSTDGKDEMRQMARWVRYWCEQEPGARIAVVVPDLQNRRAEIERHLQETLVPDRAETERGRLPWNISMGSPLAREPLIQTAFDVLKLLDERIDIQDAGRVLRSPWLRGGISERNKRALLEKCLRDYHPRQLKLRELIYRSGEINETGRPRRHHSVEPGEPQPWNSPKLSDILARLDKFSASSSGHRKPSDWAEQLDRLLVSLGWPLKSEERAAEQDDRNWQALQAWREGLRELSSLDATCKTLSRPAAIGQLHKICREKIFQPKSPATPVQVLGLYEISGLRFDHLWVMGLHNDNWPPAAMPNPFLPGSLQRRAQLPHSSPQRELEVARKVTRRLLETAPDSVFSYPGQLDGEAVLASPLLGAAQAEIVDTVPGWQGDRWQTVIFKAAGTHDEPLISPGPLAWDTAKGGSSVLRHQALCPFRAFASNRLAAEGLESPADGISPALHGSLVHQVLEFFWRETGTQQALLQLDPGGLATRVRRHVDAVVAESVFLRQRPTFSRVEADRLQRQALASLEVEKSRAPFTAIEFEKEILPVIQGQVIRLVIDRIDRLESGEEVIIDYKTGRDYTIGRVERKKWFGNRPEDPQLPLYAISAGSAPAAVVFAIVRDDGCGYSGVVRREGLFPALPPKPTKATLDLVEAGYNLPETVENWRQVLHHLMSSFLAGQAEIDPKNGRKTCDRTYCDLQPLCRIDELEGLKSVQHESMPGEAAP